MARGWTISLSSKPEPDPDAADQKKQRLRMKLRRLMNEPRSSRGARVFLIVSVITIVVSIMNFYLETVPWLIENDSSGVISGIEVTCIVIFSIEAVMRIVASSYDPIRLLACDLDFWVDILSIVPFYIEHIILAADTATGNEPPKVLQVFKLLRLFRICKLLRVYSGWRVLIFALQSSWRAIIVPGFAMLLTILMLSGALWYAEGTVDAPDDAFGDALEAMYCIFWIVATLGYDGSMGSGGGIGQCIIAVAIVAGLLFTTMPITIIGQAFQGAWDKREMLHVAMKVQEHLTSRGLGMADLGQVFKEFDHSGDGELDWTEFRGALRQLSINLPLAKVRLLFRQFDEDETGAIDYHEFCRKLFPNTEWEAKKPDADEAAADAADAADAAAAPATSVGEHRPSKVHFAGLEHVLASSSSEPSPVRRSSVANQASPGREEERHQATQRRLDKLEADLAVQASSIARCVQLLEDMAAKPQPSLVRSPSFNGKASTAVVAAADWVSAQGSQALSQARRLSRGERRHIRRVGDSSLGQRTPDRESTSSADVEGSESSRL